MTEDKQPAREAVDLADFLAQELYGRNAKARDLLGASNANIFKDAVEEIRKLRRAIAWANNSLFGSHGYFLSLRGGEANEHHLDEPIERLKATTRKDYQRIGALEVALREAKDQINDQAAMPADTSWIDRVLADGK